jgi:hypothetical protein
MDASGVSGVFRCRGRRVHDVCAARSTKIFAANVSKLVEVRGVRSGRLIHCPRLPFDSTRSDLIVQLIILRKSIRNSKRRHTNRFDQLYHLDYRA